MSDENLLPEFPEKPKLAITPRKGKTVKEAERDLKKFGAKYIKATQATGLAGFGQFILEKGTKQTGAALMVYAAISARNSVESCEDLIKSVTDPELKVRLQESKQRYIETAGKIGKDLANMDDGSRPTETLKQPVNPFPPNVAVQVVHNSYPEEKKPVDL